MKRKGPRSLKNDIPLQCFGSGSVSDDTDPDLGSAKKLTKTMKKRKIVLKTTIYTNKKKFKE